MRVFLIVLGALSLILLGVVTFKHFQPSADRIAAVADQAAKKKDPLLCNSLPEHQIISGVSHDGDRWTDDAYPREQCLNNYLRSTKDRNVCELLNKEGDKLTCYKFIAEVYHDPTLCQKLNGNPSSWKDVPICIAVAKRDVRECDILDQQQQLQYSPKTDCVLEVIRQTRDYTICAGITGPGYGSFDATGADSDRNSCLKIGGCDKPDKRQEICSMMKYPSWILPEEKSKCLTETWACPDFQ